MFGSVEQFTAIINPPQAAILAVGGTRTELDENFKPLNKYVSDAVMLLNFNNFYNGLCIDSKLVIDP